MPLPRELHCSTHCACPHLLCSCRAPPAHAARSCPCFHSATWSCHGGVILPLDSAARAMLRYLLPPVWKQELDVVEGELSC